jgi:ribosomal protein S18 acetylase RimI-like enzyme
VFAADFWLGIAVISEDEVRVVEVFRDDACLAVLSSKYSSSGYYDVVVRREGLCWRIELVFKRFDEALVKVYRGRFFEDHVEEPRVFAAVLNGKRIGWIELGYQRWNNRTRVWEFLVDEEHRGKGIGTLLMSHAVKVAKEEGARMLVLETQTNNAGAIGFYLKYGFELVGFDLAAYSNEDVEKKEVRLELGLRL